MHGTGSRNGTCTCLPPRYGGEHCQIDHCEGLDCGSHGSCSDSSGKCECESACYTGDQCEVECGAHGHCDGGACACDAGYAGSRCQLRFPGSRLLTEAWDLQLNSWAAKGEGQAWSLCCSTFEGCDTAAQFHAGCDAHNTTLTVAHNAGNGGSNPGNFTFGGFVRGPPPSHPRSLPW